MYLPTKATVAIPSGTGYANASVYQNATVYYNTSQTYANVTIPASLNANLSKILNAQLPRQFFAIGGCQSPPDALQCSSDQTYTQKSDMQVTVNGCGPVAGPFQYATPLLNFITPCNAHDVCFTRCDMSFDDCNQQFSKKMSDACRTLDSVSILRMCALASGASSGLGLPCSLDPVNYCLGLATLYYAAVASLSVRERAYLQTAI